MMLVDDWVQCGRFIAGLDTVNLGSEFQRADCAPYATAGDGQMFVNDWVQSGRYVAGLDGQQTQDGPVSEEISLLLPGDVPLKLVRIPSGSFQMGSPITERARGEDEGPIHAVTINYDFYLAKYEVTQQQWLAVMGTWPDTEPTEASGMGDDHPAYYISWEDARQFVATLNAHLENTGQGPGNLRLPSEAEWEYTCRAGTQTRFYFGDSLGVADNCEDDGMRIHYMWYCGNSTFFNVKQVGGKYPNAFGLYDMHGNVIEWCEDDAIHTYEGAPDDGSAWIGIPRVSNRIAKGGSYQDNAHACRSAKRVGLGTAVRLQYLGFRLAR